MWCPYPLSLDLRIEVSRLIIILANIGAIALWALGVYWLYKSWGIKDENTRVAAITLSTIWLFGGELAFFSIGNLTQPDREHDYTNNILVAIIWTLIWSFLAYRHHVNQQQKTDQ